MYRRLILPFFSLIILGGFVVHYFKSSTNYDSTPVHRAPNQILEKDQSKKAEVQKNAPQEKRNFPAISSIENQTGRKIPKTSLVKAVTLVAPSSQQLESLPSALINQRWKWWQSATAIPKNEYSQNQNKALAEVSQRIVIEKTKPGSSPEEFFLDSPLILFNPLKQSVGVLTGVFIVTAKSDQDFNNFLQDQTFEVVNSFSHLRMAYVKPRISPFNLAEVENLLSVDRRLQTVEYEILKGNLVKN